MNTTKKREFMPCDKKEYLFFPQEGAEEMIKRAKPLILLMTAFPQAANLHSPMAELVIYGRHNIHAVQDIIEISESLMREQLENETRVSLGEILEDAKKIKEFVVQSGEEANTAKFYSKPYDSFIEILVKEYNIHSNILGYYFIGK
jgi:hypothetical protein